MRLYEINAEFVTSLFKRIQLSAKEAVDEWKTMPGGEFIHNVVTLAFPYFSEEVLTNLVETCLRASLEREEGEFSPFSVALEPPNPDEFKSHYKFDREIDFTSANLTKLAKALDPNNYHIGVWFSPADRALTGLPQNLVIWGFKPKLLWFLTINSVSPGKISLSCLSGTKASFKCLISLAITGFVNPFSTRANPITDWLGKERTLGSIHKAGDLNNIFSRMFRQGRGGTVLLVGDDQKWKESIEQPLMYEPAGYISGYAYPTIVDKYKVLDDFESRVRSGTLKLDQQEHARDKLMSALEKGKSSLEAIYDLTTLDGATILSRNLEVFAFGAKIASKVDLQTIAISEPFEDATPDIYETINWPVGTRHRSAARFVAEARDCLAVVVSEDRKMSLFSWNEETNSVQQLRDFELMILG